MKWVEKKWRYGPMSQGLMAGILMIIGILVGTSSAACLTVQAEEGKIDSVEATVSQLLYGKKAEELVVTPGNGTYQAVIKSVKIWNSTRNEYTSVSPGTEFQLGEKYQIGVKFLPNVGYTLSDNLVASINGNAASRQTALDGSVYFAQTFTVTTANSADTRIEVRSIAIQSDVQKPVIGSAVPQVSCQVVSNAAIKIQETGWVNQDNGALGSGVFTSGNWYCYIVLRLEGEAYNKYKFANKDVLAVTVNGETWQITEVKSDTDCALVRVLGVPGNTTGNTTGNTAGTTTGNTTSTTQKTMPAVGVQLQDASSAAVYRVTAVGATVEYVRPISQSIKTVTVPAVVTIDGITYKVTRIAENALKNSKQVTKIVIGNNVTVIGAGAFSGLSKLKGVTMGANITNIGDKAFYKCKALTKITIPSKVSKIGKSAFYGCKKLKSITIKTKKLTTKKVGSKAFKGIHKKAVIKVPKSKLKAYKTMLKKRGIGKSVKVKK